jgi:short-subunit dehydrogenase
VHISPSTRVVVTGASRGIGEAVARAFASRGATLGLLSRSGDELETLAGSLAGDGHVALAADVSDEPDVRGALERFGEVDVLVVNAGVANYGRFDTSDPADVDRMTRINWLGTIHTVRAALPRMLERRSGHIVIVSSGAALRTFPEAAVYGATKAAQRGFAEAMRHELDGTGVSLTTVYPGEIATHLHDHERDTMPAWYRKDNAAPPEPLAERIVEAVEKDQRAVYYPGLVRLLRVAHGLSPRLGDAMLRRMRGASAAPRRG